LNKTWPFLFFLLLSFSKTQALQPIDYPDRDKPDLDIVDHYLHPFNGGDSMGTEREILIRGPKPGIVKALCAAFQEQDRHALIVATQMLLRLRVRQAIPYLARLLKTEKADYLVLSTAIGGLGDLGGPPAAKALLDYSRNGPDLELADHSTHLRLQALEALGSCGVSRYGKLLKKEAAKREGVERIRLLGALGNMGDPSVRPAILELLNQTQDPKLIGPALGVLSRVGKTEDLDLLDRLQSNPTVANKCRDALDNARLNLHLLNLPPEEQAQELAAYLKDSPNGMEVWAIDKLAELRTPQSLAALELHLNDQGLNTYYLEILVALRRAGKDIVRVVRQDSEVLKVR
jgi:HEAT repeat protein